MDQDFETQLSWVEVQVLWRVLREVDEGEDLQGWRVAVNKKKWSKKNQPEISWNFASYLTDSDVKTDFEGTV